MGDALSKVLSQFMILLFATITLVGSSGTFVFPPPPKINLVVDSEVLLRGETLFKKVFSDDLSCHSCHGKQSKLKFRRRKLRKVINKLAGQIKKCSTQSDRMGLSESVGVDPRDLESIQIYMAKQWKLLDYLRK